MISFSIKVVGPDFGKVQKVVQLAVARGVNEGGDKVRTQMRRYLKQDTNVIKYESINRRTKEAGKGYNRATPGRLVYTIEATGSGMPIYLFPVRDTGHGIDAKTWGVDHLFKRSFAIKGKGMNGLRARLPKGEEIAIRGLRGPSLSKELMHAKTTQIFSEAAQIHVPPAVRKYLLKMLG